MAKRKKKVIKGIASVERREGEKPVSNKKVGHGRYNEGSYIGGYLKPKRYIDKRTGKTMTEDEYERRKRANGFLQENLQPTRPGSLVKRRAKSK